MDTYYCFFVVLNYEPSRALSPSIIIMVHILLCLTRNLYGLPFNKCCFLFDKYAKLLFLHGK